MNKDLVPVVAPVTGVVLTPTSFKPDHDLTEDEWISAGRSLGATSQGVQWWIGDWLNYGFDKGYIPSERYDKAEEITKTSRTWLQVCAWVARAVPAESRRADLSFEHHKRIASLKDGQARTLLLQEAAKGNWTARELYDVATQVMSPQDETPITNGVPAIDALPVHDEPDVEVILPLQVIELGPHRLIVGDATDPDVLDKLFEDQGHAGIIWTDPPYGVDYVGKTEEALTISNDGKAELLELLVGAFDNANRYLKPGSTYYIAHADRTADLFRAAIENAGWSFRQTLVWIKNRTVLSYSDYHGQFEPIMYGWKDGANHRWFGGRDRSTVFGLDRDDDGNLIFSIPNPQSSIDHPTMKPPRLIWQQLRNSALSGDIVLDMFAGSGSTMVAAHQLGMRAFMVELDPRYANTIIARYKEMTNGNN